MTISNCPCIWNLTAYDMHYANDIALTLLNVLYFLIKLYCVFSSLYLLWIPKGSCPNQVLKSWTLDIFHNPLNKSFNLKCLLNEQYQLIS